MPLLPIDLQTLFTQLNQVAKDQTAQKDSVPHAQAAQGQQIVKQMEQRDTRVNEPQRQEEEGAEAVRRKGRREGQGKRQPRERERKKAAPEQKKDVFRDPALGSHIDVTG